MTWFICYFVLVCIAFAVFWTDVLYSGLMYCSFFGFVAKDVN